MPLTYHVLLTGGVGSRLWPLSRQSRPKQYLQLFSEFTSSVSSDGTAKEEMYREVTSNLPAEAGVFSDGESIRENVSRSNGSTNISSLRACPPRRMIDGSDSSGNCIEKSDVTSSVFSDGETIRKNVSRSHSLFELAVKRNAAFSDALIVVGNQGNKKLSAEGLHKLNVTDYLDIVEATPRNTAPAIAFAAFAARPDDVLLVTPADHIIKEGPKYTSAVKKAIKLAEQDNLVTFGIQPTRPETGYGYIEYNKIDVLSFREKPNTETAKDFLRKGNFLWNSGMFCFKAGVFLEELKKYSAEVYEKSLLAWKAADENHLEVATSMEIPSVSVDYAVMENSDRLKVVPSEFEWSDMGSFEAVYDYLREQGHPVDEAGNMVIGSNIYTAFVGMRNSILVYTENANLVLQKEVSQDIKDLYQKLEINNPALIG